MLLTALWTGSCFPMVNLSQCYETALQPFGFPLLVLGCSRPDSRPVRVCPEGREIALGLSLGDLLHHELDLDVPRGALVVTLSSPDANTVADPAPMLLMAEVIYGAILTTSTRAPLSLFLWTYLSLSADLVKRNPSLFGARDAALEAILDYPADRAEMTLESYLTLLEPGFTLPRPNAELGQRLNRDGNLTDWMADLHREFAKACSWHLARS